MIGFVDRLRNEIHIVGWLRFAIPIALALFFAGSTELFFIGHVEKNFIVSVLLAGIEACGPLILGLLTAALAVQDTALELQLTLPTRYRSTMFLRFALIILWTMLIECLTTCILQAILPWVLPKTLLAMQLTWLAPSLWFSAFGILLALLLRNQATCGAMLGFLWLIELAFHSYFSTQAWTQPWFLYATIYTPNASFWLTNRLELISTAIVCFILIWGYLSHSERRFYGEDLS